VGDVDLVILPKIGMRDLIVTLASAHTKIVKGGEQYVVLEMENGLQLDLWFAHGGITEQRDMLGEVERAGKPSNFGMLFLSRTGSAMHNVYLAQQAKSLGLHFQPHEGITRAGLVIASETEHDIFAALGLTFIAPEKRER
jgi:DNA polymerase/3'-5' exonuclease PolX